ncbi:MAG TPA: hypothetical protein VK658_13455 [Chryseolinea sp.]|nr:hypothetical protein [Chryseolinea sp.]
MKMKSLFFSAAVALTATTALAQSTEYDDMYFNSKDRQKLKEKQASEQAAFSQSPASKHNSSNASTEVYADNGTYSARNQNPEFAARSNSTTASDDAEYFSSNYSYANTYTNSSNLQNWNNSYNNWYGSPWVANNYWGSSIYGWNSPYYGSYYDSWGNPWMNPYYRSGWSSSFSMYMGNSWNYGWGGGMGMGIGMGFGYCSNPYNNGWAGWNMGFGGGYGYYGYPSVVIINNDNGRNYAYGKRGTQNGMVTRSQSANNNLRPTTLPSGGSRPTYNGSSGGGSSGGRVATNSMVPAPSRGQGQRQDDYYNRNWRTSRQADVYGGSSNSYSQPSRSSQSGGWENNSSQSQWNRSGGNDSGRSGYSGGSTSSPTRSSAPASSGSGGRTRGRD